MKVLIYIYHGLIEKVIDISTNQEIDFEEVEA